MTDTSSTTNPLLAYNKNQTLQHPKITPQTLTLTLSQSLTHQLINTITSLKEISRALTIKGVEAKRIRQGINNRAWES